MVITNTTQMLCFHAYLHFVVESIISLLSRLGFAHPIVPVVTVEHRCEIYPYICS